MDALPEHLSRFIRDLVNDHDEGLLMTALWMIRSTSLGDILEHHDLIINRMRTIEDLLAEGYPSLHAFVLDRTEEKRTRRAENEQ